MLLRSLPNLLGIFRILATPILVWLVLQNTSFGYYGAILLLLLMAASDIADGPLARRLGVVSPLGVFLDSSSRIGLGKSVSTPATNTAIETANATTRLLPS